jgi:hypothetical protein
MTMLVLTGQKTYGVEGVCHSSLMMEAVRTSETSVDNHFTRQYNPEDNSEHHGFVITYTCRLLIQSLQRRNVILGGII